MMSVIEQQWTMYVTSKNPVFKSRVMLFEVHRIQDQWERFLILSASFLDENGEMHYERFPLDDGRQEEILKAVNSSITWMQTEVIKGIQKP